MFSKESMNQPDKTSPEDFRYPIFEERLELGKSVRTAAVTVASKTRITVAEAEKLLHFLLHVTGKSEEQVFGCLLKAYERTKLNGLPLRGAVQYAVSHFRLLGRCPDWQSKTCD